MYMVIPVSPLPCHITANQNNVPVVPLFNACCRLYNTALVASVRPLLFVNGLAN